MASIKNTNSRSLVIWNNKGGVGKTTLLYFMSLNYARNNPDKKVLIIDMCPQADISASFLTRESLKIVQNQIVNLLYPKTIVGYLSYITNPGRTIELADWVSIPSLFNSNIPNNIGLICGDNLDYLASELNYRINAPKTAEVQDPWMFVSGSLRMLVEMVKTDDDWVIFIDTNPAFSIYTEIALIAGDLLLIPINADDFSYNGLLNVFKLVYGIEEHYENSRLINYLREYHFNERVKSRNMKLPQVCSIILVGGNTYETRSASAFKAFSDEALKDSFGFYKLNREIFAPLPFKIEEEKEFEKNYIDEFNKMNSVGVLSIAKGVLPMHLKSAESLNGKNVSATNDQKEKLQAQINKLTKKLDKWISPDTQAKQVKKEHCSNTDKKPIINRPEKTKQLTPITQPSTNYSKNTEIIKQSKSNVQIELEKVLDILLDAFSSKHFFSIKDLTILTKKSSKYLKQILLKICKQCTRTQWKLKDELQIDNFKLRKKAAWKLLFQETNKLSNSTTSFIDITNDDDDDDEKS